MIYVQSSSDFTDYNFFVWGMSTLLEDHKQDKYIHFTSYGQDNVRNMLTEWINKVEPTLATFGIHIKYVHTDKPADHIDYTVYFTNEKRDKHHKHDKIFVRHVA